MEEIRKLNNEELKNVTGGTAETPPYFQVGRTYLHKTNDNWRYQITKYLGYERGDHYYRYDHQEYLNHDPGLPHPYPGDYRWYVTRRDMVSDETSLKEFVRK